MKIKNILKIIEDWLITAVSLPEGLEYHPPKIITLYSQPSIILKNKKTIS